MIGIIAVLLAVTLAPLAAADSGAILWDLLVDAAVIGEVAYGDDVAITGRVSNHIGWAEQSTILVIIGNQTVKEQTGTDGVFTVSIKDPKLLPGMHMVYIHATSQDGLVGVLNMKVTVQGDYKPVENIARMLASKQALYYLGSNSTDFAKDSIEAKLYDHYQKLQQDMIAEYQREAAIEERRAELDVVRAKANAALEKSIMEELGSNEILVSRSHQMFLDSIDDVDLRASFEAQRNHTLDVHNLLTAQPIQGQINTQALLDRNRQYSIPQQLTNSYTPGFDIDEFNRKIDALTVDTQEEPKKEPIGETGTEIDVGEGVTTVYMNIDGVMTKFIHDGTGLVRAD